MGKVANNSFDLVTTDTTLTTSTVIVDDTVINLQEALSGVLHAVFKCTTAGTAGKIIHFYLLFSDDNVNFDEANVALMTEVGNFAIQADTADHRVSIPLDGVTLSAKYAKLAVMCDNASNYGVLRSAKINLRKAN
jgi:hypothetical protein